MTFVMRRPFAALVVDEETDVFDLPAVVCRRAQHPVRGSQLDQQKTSTAPQDERLALEQCFPALKTSAQPQLGQTASVTFEPLGEPP